MVEIDELAVGDDVEARPVQNPGDPVDETGRVGAGDPQYVGQRAALACLKVEASGVSAFLNVDALRTVCIS